MKIIQLTAENVKRLRAVQITPDGNVVQITGKNGQGKSSLLDSIYWALAGAGNVQAEPIRKGEREARIKLDLGELVVTRTFKRGDEKTTTSLIVESADGARFPSPQALLDGLLGALAFDPLEFARAKPAEQFDRLRRFVPDLDFDALERAQKGDYDRRTEHNREAKRLRAAADSIPIVRDDLPGGPIDVKALKDRMQTAATENTARTRERDRRATEATNIRLQREEADRVRKEADAARARARHLDEQAEELQAKANEREAALAGLAPVPDLIDVARLRATLDEAERVNAELENRQHREELIGQAREQEEASAALTAKMEARERSKRETIAAAQMPVEGLGFGEAGITLAGVPFEQASDAEKLRVSLAIALSENPKLRVIRIRDGSLLDDDSMKLLAQMAEEADAQVWVERIEPSGRVGFVISDGALEPVEVQP